jgi:hypothetical protein
MRENAGNPRHMRLERMFIDLSSNEAKPVIVVS